MCCIYSVHPCCRYVKPNLGACRMNLDDQQTAALDTLADALDVAVQVGLR
jgi:hypothetical protein